MSRASTPLSRIMLLTALVTSGCLDLPEIQYETEHLRIGTKFDGPLCRGDLDHLEQLVRTLEEQLDTSVEDPITVYLWGRADPDPPAWCEEGLLGCYSRKRDAVFTGERSVDHELVHAVIATFGKPAAIWDEGAAESLASDRTYRISSPPSEHLDTEDPSYLTAGHFSRWVLDTYGLDSYRALLRHPGSAREAFEATYGVRVEDVEDVYFEQSPQSYAAMHTCGYPELPQTGERRWEEELDIDCSLPDVYGGSRSMIVRRELSISERGLYAFSMTAEVGMILRCQDEDYDEVPSLEQPELYGDVPAFTESVIHAFPVPLDGDGEVKVLDLTPGRYEVWVGNTTHTNEVARLEVVGE